MANFVWTGTTSALWSVGSNWSVNGVAQASPPTTADDVFIGSGTGATNNPITLNITSPLCRSINCTGYTGIMTQNAGTLLTIGDATAGAGNIALKFVAGMTYTPITSAAIAFVSSNITVQTVDFGGQTTANVTYGNSTGSWQLVSSHTSTGTVTLQNGTLDTNGQTCNWNIFSSSNSNVRTLTLGASAINITASSGQASWQTGTVTNMTLNAGTSTITLLNATFFQSGTKTYYALSMLNGGQVSGGVNAFTTLTITGGASKIADIAISSSTTITGTLTLAGNSTVNRLNVRTFTTGVNITLTASTVSLSNVDFIDVTGAGLAGNAAWTGTSLGNCQGNANITFDASTTQTRTAGGSGNWSDVTRWTSRVPLPQDNVVINSGVTGTVTADMPRLGKDIDFTGFSGTVAIGQNISLFGSLTVSSSLTMSGGFNTYLMGRTTCSLTSGGFSGWSGPVVIQGPSGTYVFTDDFNSPVALSGLVLTTGTLDCATNNVNVTIQNFTAIGVGARALLMGTGTWTLVRNNTALNIWNIGSSGFTLSAASSIIIIATASTFDRTFIGANFNYGSLVYTVANSPGALIITGTSTFTTLSVGSGRTLTLPSSTTTTVSNITIAGTANSGLYLPGGANNNASAPNIAAYNISGPIDVRVRVAPTLWSGTSQELIGRWVIPNRQFTFLIDSSGKLEIGWSTDGTNLGAAAFSTVATGFNDGTPHWLRFTLDTSITTGQINFYTAPDSVSVPSSWTQLGSAVNGFVSSVATTTTDPLEVGGRKDGSNPFTGTYYRAQLLSGIDGTVVFDADFTSKAFGANSFTESSSNAATVSINGAAQPGDGRLAISSGTPGTAATLSKSSGVIASDYLVVQDSTATGGAAWFAGAHSVNVSNNTGWAFSGPATASGSGGLSTMGVGS